MFLNENKIKDNITRIFEHNAIDCGYNNYSKTIDLTGQYLLI